MNSLTEKLFIATWRSYKTFLRSGNVRLYTVKSFIEFDFAEDKQLTITQYEDSRGKRLCQTFNWATVFDNKRYYLQIEEGSPSYEIITINHTALVLMNTATLDKTFFAKKAHWEELVKNNTSLVL